MSLFSHSRLLPNTISPRRLMGLNKYVRRHWMRARRLIRADYLPYLAATVSRPYSSKPQESRLNLTKWSGYFLIRRSHNHPQMWCLSLRLQNWLPPQTSYNKWTWTWTWTWKRILRFHYTTTMAFTYLPLVLIPLSSAFLPTISPSLHPLHDIRLLISFQAQAPV
ncbi:hypothetical protein BCR39DRAFT_511878 [Naematelia encephala]|uniref:Uncharacterized protein n=1 Tax=Naematelia encephala TaxID=71784 RepID=A0A1Y2BLV4_9TREE|nr:hypothetical protein BCR39DRAFT_511878 [Naematelia encephala]